MSCWGCLIYVGDIVVEGKGCLECENGMRGIKEGEMLMESWENTK